uniref:Uncharacterized protein n=1 Tax=Rhizophora mucronata TaxID=61149 RepID=A0A2P2QI92_RHIMU
MDRTLDTLTTVKTKDNSWSFWYKIQKAN